MVVLHFAEDEANFIEADGRNYFLWRDAHGAPHMLPADCPHRGGPLWLGTLDDGRIRCPWHNSAVPIRSLERRSLPMVVNRGRITAIAPANVAYTRCVMGVDGSNPCT